MTFNTTIGDPKIKELFTRIQLLDSGIIFCSYDYDPTFEVIQKELITFCEGQSVKYLQFKYSNRIDFKKDSRDMIQKNENYNFGRFKTKYILSIFSTELLTTDSLWYFNQIRSYFLNLNAIVIIWVPENYINNINHLAPDLWRIREKVMNFTTKNISRLRVRTHSKPLKYYRTDGNEDSYISKCETLIKFFEKEKQWEKMKRYQRIHSKLNNAKSFHKKIHDEIHVVIMGLIEIGYLKQSIGLAIKLHHTILFEGNYLNPKNKKVSEWCKEMADEFKRNNSLQEADLFYGYYERYKK